MSHFTRPITQTASIANVFQSTAAAAERVFEFLEEKEETPDTFHPVVLKEVKNSIEFVHVFWLHARQINYKRF
ncbi:MAG TPA: hypothetical protein PLL80_01610 [Candidatus Pacearchaeota archaeon]|nr:hypothetical protein [Candidatus Pacearchaeota archaeon]HOK94332.1 hypothetical protein [Candidatus Pacearchaeota archaeon]HPO75283.1 hypothetical protein [Candidatus Pacearchaeota archaeon]